MLAALALVLTGCSAGHAAPGAARPVTTTVVPPTSTTQPPPRFAPSPYAWDRSASTALAVGGGAGTTVATVIAPTVGQSWLAVGTRFSAAGVPSATVWTSSDGVTWKAAPIAPGGPPSSALAAAQYRGETVVVGSVGAGANRQAAAWLSPQPGQPFTAVTVPLSSGPSSMTLVAAGALGMFATGTVDGRFALWSSTDGRRWGEQPGAEKTITGSAGARVLAMVAEGDNVYLAGSVGAGSTEAAAVWSSTDSIHWHAVSTAADQFAGPGQRVIYSLAPLQKGLVAVGAVNRGTGWMAASWVSPDGASWSPPSVDFAGSDRPGVSGDPAGGWAARSVAAVPTFAGSTSLVAAGGGPSGQGAWKSTDGLHWTPIPLPGPDAAASGWRATIAAATIDTTVIADGDPGQAHVLTDTAAGWREPSADPAVFGPVRPSALPVSLVPSGGRLLLTVRLETDPQTVGDAAVTYTTLASADGVGWSPAKSGAAGPPTVPTAGALTVRVADGWVAVGEPAAGHPEAWVSSDGRTWTAQGLLGTAGAATRAGTTGGSGQEATAPAGLPARVNGLCSTAADSGGSTATTAATATTATSGAAATTGTVVAVGAAIGTPAPASSSTPARGHQAAAWYSTAGSAWKRASVSPAAPAGTVETMSGCARTSGGLVAWGTSSTPGGASVPALWRSGTGTAWSRVNVAAFTPGTAYPITDLADGGSVWVAVSDPNPMAGPHPAGAPGGPAAPAGPTAGTGPDATFDNGQVGIWLSPDAGSTWQALDTATPPWLGTGESQADLVAFAGATPVLAGSLDGQLAVWTGTAVAVRSGPGGGSPSSSG